MPLKTIFYRKLGLRVTSFILAVVAWLYIHAEIQKTTTGPLAYKDIQDLEVRIMGEPLTLGKNLYTVDLEKKKVDIRVRGPEREVENLTRMDLTAYIDISGLKPGKAYSPVVKFVMPEDIGLVGAPPLVRVEIKDKNFDNEK